MDHIKQVANRLRGLRDAIDLTVEQMATDCNISPDLLERYESGETDIPVSFLHCIATTYGVELTALLFGEEPRMASHFITRCGHGVKVERTHAYSYMDVAAGFRGRIMSPFIVSVEPTDRVLTLNSHKGQEFNLVLEGSMEISVAGSVSVLNPGDSIMFDAERPHGMRALGDKAVKFLAIIA